MKKRLFTFGLFLLAGVALSAQNTLVTLQNQEESWFYFVIDPKELAGLPVGSPLLASRVAAFLSADTEEFPFTVLKPRAGMTLEGLPEGTHLLIGFFVLEGKSVFPVRALTLQVDMRLGQRMYGIYSEPPLMTLARGAGRLARFGKRESPATMAAKPAATAAAAAKPAPAVAPAAAPAEKPAAPVTRQAPAAAPAASAARPEPAAAEAPSAALTPPVPEQGSAELATFTRSFSPDVFSQESEGVFSMRPIAESRYWNRDGTRITEVAGYRTDTGVVLDITSVTRFSPDVSYFLYFFADRIPGRENGVTVELMPAAERGTGGLAVLWTEGKAVPSPVGTVTVNGTTCRLSLSLDELPSLLLSGSGGNPSIDLTACYYDETAREFEEFAYTTLALDDFPRVTR